MDILGGLHKPTGPLDELAYWVPQALQIGMLQFITIALTVIFALVGFSTPLSNSRLRSTL